MKKFSILIIMALLMFTALQKWDGTMLNYPNSIEANEILFVKSNSNPIIPVTVTAYSPTEEECDSDPYITAFQKPVREGTIAISRDLEKEFGWRLGDKIHIAGLGEFEVWDRMHPRWTKRVDIFFHDTEKAVSFGKKQAQVIRIDKTILKGT